MSEVYLFFADNWKGITVGVISSGVVAFIALLFRQARHPLGWFQKKNREGRRGHVLYISELSVNQNLFRLAGADISFDLLKVVIFVLFTIFFLLSFKYDWIQIQPDMPEDKPLSPSSNFMILASSLLPLVGIVVSISFFRDAAARRRCMGWAVKLEFLRKRCPESFLELLDEEEKAVLGLTHEELETATDKQIMIIYRLLGCSTLSRFYNFIRFKVKARL